MKRRIHSNVALCGWLILCVTMLAIKVAKAAEAAETVRTATDRVWVLVDTKSLVLTVRSFDNKILARFANISLGSGGTSTLHRAGDETTPLGTFRIAWIKRDSRFHRFFGVDYPNVAAAETAYDKGLIGKTDYDAILDAAQSDEVPPQQTALGGGLGIHGRGEGNLAVQSNFHWTDGCVALTNGQIERLEKWVGLGTKVVIR